MKIEELEIILDSKMAELDMCLKAAKEGLIEEPKRARRYAILQAVATLLASPVQWAEDPLNIVERRLAEIERRESGAK